MIINDKRNEVIVIKFKDLKPGQVYLDYHGAYVFATDNDFVVDLATGEAIADGSYYSGVADSFENVDAKLEIY